MITVSPHPCNTSSPPLRCSFRSPLGGLPGIIWRGDTRTTEAGTTGHSSRYGAALQRPLEPATTRARCDPPPTARCPLPASHRPLPTDYDLPCRRSAWPPLRRGGAGEAREGMVSSRRGGCTCSPAACARTQSPEAAREVAPEITREIEMCA